MSDQSPKPGVKAVGGNLLLCSPASLLQHRKRRIAAIDALVCLLAGDGRITAHRRSVLRKWAKQWVASVESWYQKMSASKGS